MDYLHLMVFQVNYTHFQGKIRLEPRGPEMVFDRPLCEEERKLDGYSLEMHLLQLVIYTFCNVHGIVINDPVMVTSSDPEAHLIKMLPFLLTKKLAFKDSILHGIRFVRPTPRTPHKKA